MAMMISDIYILCAIYVKGKKGEIVVEFLIVLDIKENGNPIIISLVRLNL